MADSSLPVTPGTGVNVDGRTEATNGDFRQVVVLGDPSVTDNVVPVVTADPGPSSTAPGLVMRLAGSATVVMGGVVSANNSSTAVLAGGAVFTGTSDDCLLYNEIRISVFASHASATDGLSIQQSSDNTNWDITDTYTIAATTGKTYSVPRQARYIRVVYTNGATLQTSFRLSTILNRANARVSSQRPNDAYTNETDLEQNQVFPMVFNGSTWDRMRGTTSGLAISSVVGSVAVYFDRGNPSVAVSSMPATTAVYIASTAGTIITKLDPSSVIAGIGSSIAVYLANTGGTLQVKLDPASVISGITSTVNVKLDTGSVLAGITGSVGVYFSGSKPIVLADTQRTSSIFTVSGTTSTAGNNTLVSPSASYNFKVFAYSLQTTGVVSSAPRFTTGASAGATELWRPLITAVSTTSSPIGANLAVGSPSYIFATGTNTTLSLYLDTATLMHYSVSYLKESA